MGPYMSNNGFPEMVKIYYNCYRCEVKILVYPYLN